MAMHRFRGVDVAIARIFNTYGPRLAPGDGRVVSNFISQALRGEPLTVYGDGSQTRSLCYVDDEIAGLLALLDSSLTGPVNIGNPDERTVLGAGPHRDRVVGVGFPDYLRTPAHRRPHAPLPGHHLGHVRVGLVPEDRSAGGHHADDGVPGAPGAGDMMDAPTESERQRFPPPPLQDAVGDHARLQRAHDRGRDHPPHARRRVASHRCRSSWWTTDRPTVRTRCWAPWRTRPCG